jgi:hypothetical protein
MTLVQLVVALYNAATVTFQHLSSASLTVPWTVLHTRIPLVDNTCVLAGGAEPNEAVEDLPDRVKATPMPAGNYTPELSEPSIILDDRECSALAAAVPIRHRWRKWHLLYSTGRDGLSLQTLFR